MRHRLPTETCNYAFTHIASPLSLPACASTAPTARSFFCVVREMRSTLCASTEAFMVCSPGASDIPATAAAT